ncbi:MAG: Inner membrane transport protein YajR [Legionellaceae bacterium]
MTELDRMTSFEIKATLSVAGLFALRLLGLFMVLPLLSLYAKTLSNATPNLIGIAVGCYGLTQALFQIPLGNLSDRYNRKIVIAVGLIIFIAGSVIAAYADSIWILILGRALQGVGAVGSSTIALLTDYTRENQRTKVMAIFGASIGISFIVALMLGPILNKWLRVSALFEIAAFFGILCLLILYKLPPIQVQPIPPNHSFVKQLFRILKNKKLVGLNLGIFSLHLVFTSTFVVLPLLLNNRLSMQPDQLWRIYFPSVLMGCLFILPLLRRSQAEKPNQKINQFMLVVLMASLLWLWKINLEAMDLIIGLSLFFAAFNFLEANLPAQISKLAPQDSRGTTMGIYSCSQFLGIFVGGLLGGNIYGYFNPSVIFVFCAILTLFWIIINFFAQRS